MDIKQAVSDGVKDAFSALGIRKDPATGEHNPAPTAPTAPANTAGQHSTTEEKHPVLVAALAAGVDTGAKFAALQERAKHGDAYAKDVDERFKKEAVRKFGAEKGTAKVTTYANLNLDDKIAFASDWQADSDEKFGVGKDGAGATRETAASAAPQSVPAEDADNGKHGTEQGETFWSKLSDEQRAFGTKNGYNTAEKREAFAKNALGIS